MELVACGKKIDLSYQVKIMGILNVTPDSFFDGGKNIEFKNAINHAIELKNAGADFIDIGGESTRPGADPVPEEIEYKRVIPVIEKLASELNTLISVDTRKPKIAEAALKAGAIIVNDVEANRNDPEMWQIVSKYNAGYVLMHMLGSPKTMQISPTYEDVVNDIFTFFNERISILNNYGIKKEQIILDPGIGFGKTLQHNLELIARIRIFKKLGCPLLLGASRKSFIGQLFDAPKENRLPGSLACACWAAFQGVNIVRVHDVKETVQAVKLIEKLLSITK
jgi:dihydropteroate synthase